jgi:anthranilate phosphoribosyltransferase
MIIEVISKLRRGEDLTPRESADVFRQIMSGAAPAGEMKDFLIALAEKGEKADEIAAAVKVMREKMTRVKPKCGDLLDTCGTGGGSRSFNISTLVAIVAAGCGAKVAKHGNRSYTSHCGSADILEKLGVKIDLSPEKAAECIDTVGVAFLFAPLYHSAMKHVAPVRKDIKRRTIFNVIGPLSNPALANRQLIGVFDPSLTEIMADALLDLGSKRAFVVHGLDGFDEVSISGRTKVSELSGGKVETYEIGPEDLGVKAAGKDAVACKTMEENVRVFNSILDGKGSAHRDMLLANAGVALTAAGIADGFLDGAKRAAECIDSGNAKRVLEEWIRFADDTD